MDAIQPVLSVLLVLGLLGGALYWLRVKGVARFSGKGLGAFGRQGGRQMQAIERLPLTPQHSLHLVSVGGRTLLVAVSPGGCSVVDGVGLPISAESMVGHR
jgi:flagellar biogenesis protein FliO